MSGAERAGPRFRVREGSQSHHCCFAATVVDTARPYVEPDGRPSGDFEPMCECFTAAEALWIAAALNAMPTPPPGAMS